MKTILVVDDEKSMCSVLRILFREDGYSVLTATQGREAIQLISDGAEVDLIISDLRMPDLDGMDILSFLRKTNREIPLVMITAYGTIEDAVEAMKKGAVDFITKPFNKDVVRHLVQRIFRMEDLVKENRALKSLRKTRQPVYCSPQMKEVFDTVERAAGAPTPVLILGESGTGKGLVAKALHAFNECQPFVEINCPAIPDSLLESELFGYQKGAFTGATATNEGKVRMADGGILFFDEIADLPRSIQPKLLKLLDEKTFVPLGSNRPIRINTRILCATNRDLKRMVREGSFREDLYYRINAITISIPPLRERKEDIAVLADQFLTEFSLEMKKEKKILSAEVRSALLHYDWPGNVRELRNVIERAAVLSKDPLVGLSDIPCDIRESVHDCAAVEDLDTLSDSERHLLEDAIRRNHGNLSAAARELGIERGKMRSRMHRYQLG
jgi:DNA-binding NtrC family response regulator